MNSLTEAQLDGRACLICGRTERPMVPIYVETPTSTMLFRCESCECSDERAREIVNVEPIRKESLKIEAAEYERMLLAGAKAWADIPDAAQWLRDLRNGTLTPNDKDELLSKCCTAPLRVSGGREGTHWFVCTHCQQPSDPQ